MVKDKAKEHGLEYVILNDDESELWEIDYDAGHAANVSEYVQLDSLKQDSIVRYSGRIEDSLSEQRRCKNIQPDYYWNSLFCNCGDFQRFAHFPDSFMI